MPAAVEMPMVLIENALNHEAETVPLVSYS